MEKTLLMFSATHMFVEIFYLMQVALIPVIIQEFQLSLLEASLVATVPSLAALLTMIPSGFLADRFKTSHLLFTSVVIEGLAALLVGLTGSFWVLILGASLVKIASPIYHTSGLSQITLFTKRDRLSRSVGFHNALGSLGAAAGVITLAVCLQTPTLGWRWAYLFWAAPIIIWGFVLLTSLPPKNPSVEKVATESKGKSNKLPLIFSSGFLTFLFFIVAQDVGFMGSTTFMTTYFVEVRNLTQSTASLIFGLGPFIGVIGSLGGGYLGEKMNAKKTLTLAITGCTFALFMLLLASHLYYLAFIYLIYSFFNNVTWSPINMIVADITPTSTRGLNYSVYFLTEGIVASITPTLAVGAMQLSGVWIILPFSIVFLTAAVAILQILPSDKPH